MLRPLGVAFRQGGELPVLLPHSLYRAGPPQPSSINNKQNLSLPQKQKRTGLSSTYYSLTRANADRGELHTQLIGQRC